jgi:hypothetical protein
MPHPDVTRPLAAFAPGDPSHGLIECLADYLAPLFSADPDDRPAARMMAIRAMISYRPEMQADFIAVARSVAFSMSALAALSRAATEEMPPALRLRYFSVANALSRSADQSERTMERRRRQLTGERTAAGAVAEMSDTGFNGGMPLDEPGACDPEPDDLEIIPGLGKEELAAGEAAIEAAVAEAMLEYTSRCMPAVPAADGSAGSPRTADSAGTTAASPKAPEGGGAVGGAKSELAAISVSQRFGAMRQREREFERSLGAQRGLGQAAAGGERVRFPYGHETAAARPEVPI